MKHPAFMRTRLAVRRTVAAALAGVAVEEGGADERGEAAALVLVGLSGGADSLSLAAALASEASKLGVRAGAIVVDHGLQDGSAGVAERAAEQARGLGLDPVVVRAVDARDERGSGPEAAARSARYAAFAEVAAAHDAGWVLTAHTRDDQAEQVLLSLARGSGTRSLAGIPPVRELAPGTLLLRPFLVEEPEVTRATTVAACAEIGLEPWHDPHNSQREYSRVRVRADVLPAIEKALGSGVAANLARTADLAREDADALDALADTFVAEWVADPAPHERTAARRSISREGVAALRELPAALRQRVIRHVAQQFDAPLTRAHTLEIAALVTHWRGQGPIFAPLIRVDRVDGELLFTRQMSSR